MVTVEFIALVIAPKSFLFALSTIESVLVINSTSSKNVILIKVFESNNLTNIPLILVLGFMEIMSTNVSTMTVYLSCHLLQAASCENSLLMRL